MEDLKTICHRYKIFVEGYFNFKDDISLSSISIPV